MRKIAVEELKKRVEAASKELLDGLDAEKKRGHLGASQIGHRCARQAWYSFRWFYRGQHTARMLRLFNRGHQEEERIIRWMRAAGYKVREHSKRLVYSSQIGYNLLDWDDDFDSYDDVSDDPAHILMAKKLGLKLQQFGFVACDGHFCGSCDGIVSGPHLPDGWGLIEFKTMNDKAFKDTVAKSVLSAKPIYWIQMQIYMNMLSLPWALFISVNKNDDDLYFEIVNHKPEVAEQYISLAKSIIDSKQPPQRIKEDPSWFECKYCDFREICHYDKQPDKNCRTCQYSTTAPESNFYCELHRSNIPYDFQQTGCDKWFPH
jgi:hypothetical protein